VAVTEAGVDANGDRPLVAGGGELVDHRGRTDVGQQAVLEDNLKGVVAEDVGGETDDRRRVAGGMTGMQSAQGLVARNGIDPDAGGVHLGKDLGGWTCLHRKTGLESGCCRHGLDIGDALADQAAIINPERSADLVGELAKKRVGEGHGDKRNPQGASQGAPSASHAS